MQIIKKSLVCALSLFMSTLAFSDILIFPAQGLYGLEQQCRENTEVYKANDSSIACSFNEAVSNETMLQQMNQTFRSILQQNFTGQVVDTIAQTTKHRTYVASLEVLRASEYVVHKESTAEIFLPVTLSLKLTNILTGEVIYSDSSTLSQPIKVLRTDLDTDQTRLAVQQKFQSSLLALTREVSESLKQKLKITEIETQVIDQWKSYLILDKGFNHGVSLQDELSSSEGDLIRIVHVDSEYAVALPVLKQSKSQKFVKVVTNTRQSMNKPKALLVDVLTYQGESKDLIEQIFSDAVGENAAFTLTPVNHRYSTLAQSVGEQTELAQFEDINQRELPEFFVRVNVIPVIGYQQQIGQITQQQIVHSQVFAEMIDRSGRVIYSAQASDEINEVISEGMGFSLEARKEIALKNALIKLGEKFQKGIQFTRADLKVSGANHQTIQIDDQGGRLTIGMKVNLYRQDKAAGREVLIPTWEATVIDKTNSKVIAQLDFPVSGTDRLPVRAGDKVLVDSSAPVGDSKMSRVLCPSLHTEQVGEIPFYGFGPLIYHAFTSQSKHPFYATGSGFKGQTLFRDAVIRMTENAGFKKDLNVQLHIPKNDCLQPVFKIEVKKDSVNCNASQTQCDVTLVMSSGARRFNHKAERVGAYGLQQEIHLEGIDLRHKNEMYNIQMFNSLPKILNQVVKKADATQ